MHMSTFCGDFKYFNLSVNSVRCVCVNYCHTDQRLSFEGCQHIWAGFMQLTSWTDKRGASELDGFCLVYVP